MLVVVSSSKTSTKRDLEAPSPRKRHLTALTVPRTPAGFPTDLWVYTRHPGCVCVWYRSQFQSHFFDVVHGSFVDKVGTV